MSGDPTGAAGSWTLLTNHGHVLLALVRDGDLRQRDIANLVGITEGAVHRILHDLEAGGHVEVHKVGRRNRYRVNLESGLRHPMEAGHCVGQLFAAIGDDVPAAQRNAIEAQERVA